MFWGSVGDLLALQEAPGDTGHASFQKLSPCSTITLSGAPTTLTTSVSSFGFSSPLPILQSTPKFWPLLFTWCANHSYCLKRYQHLLELSTMNLPPPQPDGVNILLAKYFLNQHRPPFFPLSAPNFSDLLGPTSNTTTHESSSVIPLSLPRSFFSEFSDFIAHSNYHDRILLISVSDLRGLSSLHFADPLVTKKFPGCFKRCTVKK